MTPWLTIQVCGFIFPIQVDEPHEYWRACRAADFVNFWVSRQLRDARKASMDAVRTVVNLAAKALYRCKGLNVAGEVPSQYAESIVEQMGKEHPDLSEFNVLVISAVSIAFDFLSLWEKASET
jgi:hypothetical protein